MIQAAQKNNPAQPKILTYSTTQPADYQVKNIQYSLTGANFSSRTAQAEYQVQNPLSGHFNIENLVSSLITVEQAGFDLADVVTTTAQLKGAPGRMQVIRDDARSFAGRLCAYA